MIKVELYTALKRMNELSKDNIPFSIKFVSCDLTRNNSKGVKKYNNVVLRTGYSADKGIKSRSLIGFIDLDSNTNKWFYLPLLLNYNEYEITHGKH